MSNIKEVLGGNPQNEQSLTEEVYRLLKEFEKVPFADVLVQKFIEYTDPQTLTVNDGEWGKEIVGDIKNKKVLASLRIRQLPKSETPGDEVTLEVYDNKAEMISEGSRGSVVCQEIVQFTAREIKTGTWGAGVGYSYTYGIHMREIFGGLVFPSERARWVLGLAYGLAQAVSDFYEPQQPVFYLGTRRGPEPRRRQV